MANNNKNQNNNQNNTNQDKPKVEKQVKVKTLRTISVSGNIVPAGKEVYMAENVAKAFGKDYVKIVK